MVLNDTCDIEIWDKDGLTSIRKSKKLDIDYILRTPELLFDIFHTPSDKLLSQLELKNKLSNITVYQGIINGNKEKLESELSINLGKKIIVIQVK